MHNNKKFLAPLLVIGAIFAVLAGVGTAHAAATNIYVAQSNTGSANGTSCANAYAYTWFNSSSNWGSGANQIGPGTTVNVCGTITLPANTEAFVFNGSGTSGSPITLYFQSGAVLASPEWPADGSGGAIDLGSNSYVTVNGNGGANGMTEGVIEATSNGDSGAKCLSGSCTSHGDSNGVEANDGAKNVTIEGLGIIDMYVTTTGVPNGGGGTCIYEHGNVSNWTITGNTMHDVGWCISLQYDSGVTSNLTISNNQIYNIDHGIALGGPSAGATLTNVNIYGNNIHDFANWDTSADIWHHDGIHIWGYNDDGSDAISNVNIYDNKFGGSVGQNVTADIFVERNGGNTKNVSIYNNTLIDTGNGADNDGLLTTGQDGGYKIYNNTIDCTSPGNQDVGIGTSNSPSVTIINNIVSGCQLGLMYLNGGSVASGQIHNNLYAAGVGNCSQGGNDCFDYGSSGWYGTFSTWQSQTGDANSTYVTSANLSSLGVPLSGSGAIGTGANLTSLGIPTLDSDIAGVARPASGAWDIGAYEVSSGSTGSSGGTTPPPTVTAPAITSSLSASATAGSSFSYQIAGSNSPTSYSASNLPAGLTVSGGLISGTPSTAGNYNVTISATNSGGTGSATLAINVAAAPVTTTKYTLTVAKAGTGSGTVSGSSVSCGSTCSESVTSGTAVTLTATPASGSTFSGWSGACSGTGTCSVTVKAATTVTASFALQNNTTPTVTAPAITSVLSASATVGKAFSYQITASNNPANYNIANLPAGLTVSNTALISGTPTTAGTYNVTLSATNSGGTGTATLMITVAASTVTTPPTTTTSTPTGSCSTIGSGWTDSSFTAQTSGTFTLSFDATPAANDIDSTIGVSTNAASQFTDMAAIVRFNPSGDIDAISGPGYSAASTYAYQGGTKYHFVVTVNLAAKTYSATVQAAAGSAITIALNYPFRDTQSTAASLEYVDAHNDAGSTTVCNLNITTTGTTGSTGSTGSTGGTTTSNPTSTTPVTTVSAPVMSSLSPNSGAVGTSVTITGTNFGATSTVFINDLPVAANVASSPTSLTFTMPSSLGLACTNGSCPLAVVTPGQSYQVTVQSNGQTSNALTFNVSSLTTGCTGTCTAPTISSLNPSSGAIGASVTVTGSSLGSSDTVLLNNMVAASNVSSNGTSLTFSIPSSLTAYCTGGEACPDYALLVTPNTYNVTVVANGETSNALTLAVTAASSGSGSNSGGTGSSSSTVSQLQAEVASLLAEIQQLEAQLAAQGGSTSGTGTGSGSGSYHWSRDLYRGESGSDVTALQQLLINAGGSTAAQTLSQTGATGYFGATTQNALAAYQQAHGITPSSGYFGAKTQASVDGQ